jgi:hypothetical protein
MGEWDAILKDPTYSFVSAQEDYTARVSAKTRAVVLSFLPYCAIAENRMLFRSVKLLSMAAAAHPMGDPLIVISG